MVNKIENCINVRVDAAKIVTNVFKKANNNSELDIATKVHNILASDNTLLSPGWYTPPPNGIGMLFGSPKDNYKRLFFRTLRDQEFWPSSKYCLDKETVGIIYVSPVTSKGVLADWGCTFYSGDNVKVQNHLVNCLDTVEKLAEYAQVGKKFSDISIFAEDLFKKQRIASNFIIVTTKKDTKGINCGHDAPFSHQEPTNSEFKILNSKDVNKINNLISQKRLFIGSDEDYIIPKTIAFTAELRMQSMDDPLSPNVFFHLIVSFDNGIKKISANYNSFFKAMGMDYIQSKYG